MPKQYIIRCDTCESETIVVVASCRSCGLKDDKDECRDCHGEPINVEKNILERSTHTECPLPNS